MKILSIIPDTIVDGPRMRSSIYVSGCWHKCKNCHNPSSWNPENGKDMTFEEIINKIISYGHKYLTISGGCPFCHQVKDVVKLVRSLKEKIPEIDVLVYTGYTLEELEQNGSKDQRELLKLIDGLIDGKFVESLRDESCLFRGSTNQRYWTKTIDGEFTLDNGYN